MRTEIIKCLLFSVLIEMVDNFAKADAAVANAFFQQFYTALLQDLFFVLTDTDHKSGMKNAFSYLE